MQTSQTFDIMIVAAGNGTRMGDYSLPKILTKINGKSNLHNTFDRLKEAKNIGHIYIIVNKRNHEAINASVNEYVSHYTHPLIDAVSIIEIESGRGDGHAVIEASEKIGHLGKIISSMFFVMWGDAYLTSGEIFNDCTDILENNKNVSMIIPVINERNPYVTFIVDKNMECLGADFSKRGENHPSGFHDQCIFLCNRRTTIELLKVMHNAYLKNGRYVTDSGELTFLYLVHFLYNVSDPAKAIITDSPVLSYNTMGEVKEIEKILLQ